MLPTSTPPAMRRRRAGGVPVLAALVLGVLVLAGCGVTDEEAPGDPRQEGAAELAGPSAPPRPALARGTNELVDAWTPASERRPILESAYRLYRHVIEQGGPEQLADERARVLRLEVGRSQDAVRAVASDIATLDGRGAVDEARVQLVSAAADRERSLDMLAALLDADPVGVEEADLAGWEHAWGESLRATRAATTLLQDARQRAGLEPMPEEALR